MSILKNSVFKDNSDPLEMWNNLLPLFNNNLFVLKVVPPARGPTRSGPKPAALVGGRNNSSSLCSDSDASVRQRVDLYLYVKLEKNTQKKLCL